MTISLRPISKLQASWVSCDNGGKNHIIIASNYAKLRQIKIN